MKKFSLLREEIESNSNFICNISADFNITARSESEATAKLKIILDKIKSEMKSYDVNSIEKSELEEMSEKLTPSTAIMNTQKLMSDYLNNKGANKVDSTYLNLQKMLNIFQSSAVSNMYPELARVSESNDVKELKAELKTNDIDESIKNVEDLIKTFNKNEGQKDTQQFQNYTDLLDMLKDIKKNLN